MSQSAEKLRQRIELIEKEKAMSAATKMDDTENSVIQALINIIVYARNTNQDGVRFKAEVESRISDQVTVTYRLEVETSRKD